MRYMDSSSRPSAKKEESSPLKVSRRLEIDYSLPKFAAGQAVAFAGPLRHAGYPITAGTRLILVLFLYVEDFNYGPYLQHACNATSAKAASPCQSKDAIRSSGSAPGSYVVYRETVELMNSLEIRVGADA